MNSLFKKPSAWIPIVMSLAALSLLLGYLMVFGIDPEPAQDEGTAAHLFQLLMGGQIPTIVFFLLKWVPQQPRQAMWILALQMTAAIAAFAPVFILEL